MAEDCWGFVDEVTFWPDCMVVDFDFFFDFFFFVRWPSGASETDSLVSVDATFDVGATTLRAVAAVVGSNVVSSAF